MIVSFSYYDIMCMFLFLIVTSQPWEEGTEVLTIEKSKEKENVDNF